MQVLMLLDLKAPKQLYFKLHQLQLCACGIENAHLETAVKQKKKLRTIA